MTSDQIPGGTEHEVSKPLPELPAEVWSRIIRRLKRPPPPKGGAQWSEMHQQDLSVCLRVSKMFFQATIPHLYHTAFVVDLPSFFETLTPRPRCRFDIASTPQEDIAVSQSPTKLAALKYVRTLHLVQGMVPRGALYEDLLSWGGEWWAEVTKGDIVTPKIGMSVSCPLRTRVFFRQVFQILMVLRDLSPLEHTYLPSLQNLCTGSYYVHPEGSAEQDVPWFGMQLVNHFSSDYTLLGIPRSRDLLGANTQECIRQCRVMFSHWFRRINTPHLCLGDLDTVYRVKNEVIMFWEKPERGSTVCKHDVIHSILADEYYIAIERRNIIIFSNRSAFEEDFPGQTRDMPKDMELFAQELAKSVIASKAVKADTPQKVMNQYMKETNTTVELYGLYGKRSDTATHALERCKTMQTAFDAKAGYWEGIVKFYPRSKAPKCPACGS